jgi:putative tricarboxylic transport membrane protein
MTAERKGAPLKGPKRTLVSVVALSLVLFACGNGDDDADGATTDTDTTDTDTTDTDTDTDDGEEDGEAAADLDYPDPNETLTFTVAFSPGGGNDIMSRLFADLLRELDIWPGNITVENVEGGSGARGWGQVYSQTGDPYHITTTSGSFTATPLQADTGWEPTEFTPLALLATDEVALFVAGDSEFDTLEEFLAAAEDSPPVIAGVGATQLDFLAPAAVFNQAGLDWDYVSHDGTPEATSTLLSGSADALMRVPGPVFGLVEAGDLKPLAISGPNRLDALPDVPTFEEEGFEIDVTFIRGLVMPPDIDPAIISWWEDAIAQIVDTEEWQEYIDENLLTENLVYGEEFGQLIADVYEGFEVALREEGVLE